LFVAWVIFSFYQTINEAILNPPPIEQNQVSERQGKLNTKFLEDIKTFHAAKTKKVLPAELERDPFEPLALDISAE
ncbi:MAG: hypothetical protein PHH01_05035, partial [Patescibacteria group bacterium]|nr:hypothetical protein [Patescibacteria group bacterium]